MKTSARSTSALDRTGELYKPPRRGVEVNPRKERCDNSPDVTSDTYRFRTTCSSFRTKRSERASWWPWNQSLCEEREGQRKRSQRDVVVEAGNWMSSRIKRQTKKREFCEYLERQKSFHASILRPAPYLKSYSHLSSAWELCLLPLTRRSGRLGLSCNSFRLNGRIQSDP